MPSIYIWVLLTLNTHTPGETSNFVASVAYMSQSECAETANWLNLNNGTSGAVTTCRRVEAFEPHKEQAK
jgi:hypothetical protein